MGSHADSPPAMRVVPIVYPEAPEQLLADRDRALDGWVWSASALSAVRQDLERVRAENRELRQAAFLGYSVLSDPRVWRGLSNPQKDAAWRITSIVEAFLDRQRQEHESMRENDG